MNAQPPDQGKQISLDHDEQEHPESQANRNLNICRFYPHHNILTAGIQREKGAAMLNLLLP